MSFKMPWESKASKPSGQREASLSDILPTNSDRVALLLLVVLCTDEMRNVITAAFEQPLTELDSQNGTGNINDLLILDDEPQEGGGKTSTDRADLDRIKQWQLYAPQMLTLKDTAVQRFNDWRTSVLRRIGEALSVRPDLVKQAKQKHTANQDSERRRKKYQDYIDWAEGKDTQSMGEDVEKASATIVKTQFPRIETPLLKFDEQQRALILNSCLFMILSLESYSAYSRVLLKYMCRCFNLPSDVLASAESVVALSLIKSTSSAEMNADQARERQAAEGAMDRKWKVGLATVGGAALIGLTGGLAAPLLLGFAGTIMGGVGLGGLATLLGATIANPVTVAALFGALGGKYGRTSMEAYTKDIEDFDLVSTRRQNHSASDASTGEATTHKLRVVIGISGWLLTRDDIVDPWRIISQDSCECFALRYESESLLELGNTIEDILRESAYSLAQAGALSVLLPIISSALLPVSLLRLGKVLDNPFSIAFQASDKAGKVLAAALMDKAQGNRPVSLVGYSLGARVIYSCLLELADRRAFGLIEDAVLAGAPVPSDEIVWRKMRSVVMGRLSNAYTTSDLILGYCYRVRSAQFNVAGLQAVTNVNGVENKDVSYLIRGHNQYRLAMGQILQEMGFDELNEANVTREIESLRLANARENQVHEQAKRDGRLREEEDSEGRILMRDTGLVETAVTRNVRSESAEIDGLVEATEKIHINKKPGDDHNAESPSEQGHVSYEKLDCEDEGSSRIVMTDLDPEPLP